MIGGSGLGSQVSLFLKHVDAEHLGIALQRATPDLVWTKRTKIAGSDSEFHHDLRVVGQEPVVLTKLKWISNIQWLNAGNHVLADAVTSPVVELFPCTFRSNVLVRGRLYFESRYHSATGRVEKDGEFLSMASMISKIAKHGLRFDKQSGAYWGAEARAWYNSLVDGIATADGLVGLPDDVKSLRLAAVEKFRSRWA